MKPVLRDPSTGRLLDAVDLVDSDTGATLERLMHVRHGWPEVPKSYPGH